MRLAGRCPNSDSLFPPLAAVVTVAPTEGFYYDIAAADVTAKHRADVTISRESLDAATVCGLCPTSETTEGKIRLRAMKAPTEAITAEYWLRSGKE